MKANGEKAHSKEKEQIALYFSKKKEKIFPFFVFLQKASEKMTGISCFVRIDTRKIFVSFPLL